jgi:hypothetical protein
MLQRLVLVGVVLVLAAVPVVAGAQTSVGGDVPSFVQVSVVQPNGFGSFPKRSGTHTYSLNIAATVTATDYPMTLSISDGGDLSGARHGHLVSRSTVMPAALQVAGLGSAWLGLDAAADPSLAHWIQPISQSATTVRLRQQVSGAGPRSGYQKLLLLTVSAQSP